MGRRPSQSMTPGHAAGPVLLGIDIGTTNSKGVACLPDGSIVGQVRLAHGVDRPSPGWAEHDAEHVWWGDTAAVCRELVAQVGDASRVRAVAVTTCGPCLVPVDGAGRPLRAGILYGVDTRATSEIERMEERIGRAAIQRLGGMPLTSQSVGPKLAWVARHEPAVVRRTATWHTATSFIVERLAGVAAIDQHQASYFGPFTDAEQRTWDLRYADGLDLAGRLPERHWPGEVAGTVTNDAARETGLRIGTPVLVGTSDGPMEALAVGAIEPGTVAIAHGSTTTLTTFAAPAGSPAGLWLTDGLTPDRPCVGAGLAATGTLIAWASAMFGGALEGADARVVLGREAAASKPGAGGLLVLPSFAGEAAPVLGSAARGVIAGLTLSHSRGDLYRAVLEGIAFGVRQLIESFESAGLPIHRLRATGGGTRDALGMQIMSDVTGCAQEVAPDGIGAAHGAARLAAGAVGLATSGDDWFVGSRRIEPDPATAATYDEAYRWFRALARDARPTMHALVALDHADRGGRG
ncbi:MAG TPA: FGGY family carbohydrate kinase [Candidatus Saccharimonadales bacterium]|nr:FGGY family carbohydrate kinase [Candidatus Saccharimonadales bacterium]